MSVKSSFEIILAGLKNGVHSYDFKIDKALFESFQHPDVHDAAVTVEVTVEKSDVMLRVQMQLDGWLALTCDRSGDDFQLPLHMTKQLLVRFSDEDVQTEDDDCWILSRNTPTIDLKQLLYDHLAMDIPMRKLHPRYAGEVAVEDDETLFYSSDSTPDGDTPNTDPRWEALKGLNFDN